MAYQEKYSVAKRGQVSGPFLATEIIDLLRMKEISTIHKVQLGKNWLTVSDFIDQFEKGLLPEQNLDKVFEDEPESEPEPEPEPVLKPEAELEPEPENSEINVPEPGPATEIHINRSGTQFGPYLFKELKDYLKAGNLRFSDMVWFEGVAEWVPLSKIPGVAEGLSSLGSAAPPPPKPPPAPVAPSVPPLLQAEPATPENLPKQTEPENEDESEDIDDAIGSSEKPDFDTENLASHGARLVAGLVDGIILLSVIGLLLSIVGVILQFDSTLAIAGVVAYFLLGWLYYGLGESSKNGGFIGKRMSKIKVVRISNNSVPGFGVSTLRSLLKILFSLSIILPFVVFLTPRRQGIHDLICGTLVKSNETED